MSFSALLPACPPAMPVHGSGSQLSVSSSASSSASSLFERISRSSSDNLSDYTPLHSPFSLYNGLASDPTFEGLASSPNTADPKEGDNMRHAFDQDESLDVIDILRERLLKSKSSSTVERALKFMASRSLAPCTPLVAKETLVAPIVVVSSPQDSPEDWSEDFVWDDSVDSYSGENKQAPAGFTDVDDHLDGPSSFSDLVKSPEMQTALCFDNIYDLAVSRVITRSVSGLGIVFDELEPSYPDRTMVDSTTTASGYEPMPPKPRLRAVDLDILASPFELESPRLATNAPIFVVCPQAGGAPKASRLYHMAVPSDTSVHDNASEDETDMLESPILATFPSVIDSRPRILETPRVKSAAIVERTAEKIVANAPQDHLSYKRLQSPEFSGPINTHPHLLVTPPILKSPHKSFVSEQRTVSSPSMQFCVISTGIAQPDDPTPPRLVPTIFLDVISPIIALPPLRLVSMHHPVITRIETPATERIDQSDTISKTQEYKRLSSPVQRTNLENIDLDSPVGAALISSPLVLGLPSMLPSGRLTDEGSPVSGFVHESQLHPNKSFELAGHQLPTQVPSGSREASGSSQTTLHGDDTILGTESPTLSDCDGTTDPLNLIHDLSPFKRDQEQESPLQIDFLTLSRFPKRRLYNIAELDTPPSSPALQVQRPALSSFSSLRSNGRPLAAPACLSSVSAKKKSLQPLLSIVNAPGHRASYTSSPTYEEQIHLRPRTLLTFFFCL